VRREDAQLAGALDVRLLHVAAACRARRLVDQLERQQRRVPFVHVEAFQARAAQRSQQAHAADTEHRLLHEPIASVAPIQLVGQGAVFLAVFREVGVQE
jgi:hypothetical protein